MKVFTGLTEYFKARVNYEEVCEGMEYISSAIKKAIQKATVGAGTLSVVFAGGWFSATDVVIRVTSCILFSWFAMLSAIIFFISFSIQSEYKRTRKVILIQGISTIVLSVLVLNMVVSTVAGASSLMRLATTQQFKKELTALDYYIALSDAAWNAGYPFGTLLPFGEHKWMHVDGKYLNNSPSIETLCETPGRAFPAEKSGEVIEGILMPIEGNQIAIIDNSSKNIKYIELFGIRDDDTDGKQKNMAVSTLTRTAKRITKDGTMRGSCFRPSENSEKWACSISHILHDQELDVATILLENGRAKTDVSLTKGTAFEKLYIDAQLSAASKGCGIWSKGNN
ncbi:hypothetical protein [Azospirillum largimobile]